WAAGGTWASNGTPRPTRSAARPATGPGHDPAARHDDAPRSTAGRGDRPRRDVHVHLERCAVSRVPRRHHRLSPRGHRAAGVLPEREVPPPPWLAYRELP